MLKDDAYGELVRRTLDALGLATRLTGALETAIAALADAGTIDDTDAAAVEVARCMAVAVTLDPTNAALWREYRAAVAALMEAGADGSDDSVETFRLSLTLPAAPRARGTEVGDPEVA